MSTYDLTNYTYKHHLNTRWRDVDSFGHVNNSIFLSYIEDARIILLSSWNLNDSTKSIIVASIKINYLNQLKHPSKLFIGQNISRIGKTSFDIMSNIYSCDGKIQYASAKVTCVCFDYINNIALEVYQEIKKSYTKY